jgi:hypothetical protein
MTSKTAPGANLPRATLAFRPHAPMPPSRRGDTGRGPLPKCCDGKESRHVKLTDKSRGGKSGGF